MDIVIEFSLLTENTHEIQIYDNNHNIKLLLQEIVCREFEFCKKGGKLFHSAIAQGKKILVCRHRSLFAVPLINS